MMPGHERSDLVIVAMKPANKAKKAPCGGVCGGGRSGVGGAKGGGPRGIRTSKARTGLRARVACQRRWSVYGDLYVPTATKAQIHHAARRRGRRGILIFPKSAVCRFFLPLFSIEDQLQEVLFHCRCNKSADQLINAHAPKLSLER